MMQGMQSFNRYYLNIASLIIGLLFVQCKSGENILSSPNVSIPITTEMIDLARIAKQPTLENVLQTFYDHPAAVMGSLNDLVLSDKCISALHGAITLEDEEIIRALLARGVDINASTHHGFTPLHRVVFSKNESLFKFLLSQGDFDLRLKDDEGNTPLHIAAMRGCSTMCEVLLSCKAAINDQNNSGSTPLHLVASRNDVETAKQLLKDAAINLNLQDEDGDAPLHLSVGWEDLKLFDMLLGKGDVQLNLQNKNMQTPLHVAVVKNNVQAVESLLQAGAMVNLQDCNGNTPLHLAAGKGYWHIISTLRSGGGLSC